MAPPAFDLFCRVIDNYGDAGVCWRLARQLASRGSAVRLWIDNFRALARLLPALNPDGGTQTLHAVTVRPWAEAAHASPPCAGVVIEAFACALPAAYEARMTAQHCLWINLEYLSAEDWVEGCHGLPSPQANGVPKYFFFPGFTTATGGLLRETDLLARRTKALEQDRRARLRALIGPTALDIAPEARLALLFCYPDVPLAGLQAALSAQARPTHLLVPGATPPGLSSQGSLHVQPIPFVPQAQFDDLLWCCDLNFVRGEDSLVRALWAGTPLLWHIYTQASDAHLDKLEAWMTKTHCPLFIQTLQRAWNGHDDDALAQALIAALQPPAWEAWRGASAEASQQLAEQPDLVSHLLTFCQQHRQKR